MRPPELATDVSSPGASAVPDRPGFWPALGLAMVLTLAGALTACAVVLSVVHPNPHSFHGNPYFAALAAIAALQAQSAKTLLYVICFFVILPVSVLVGLRLGSAAEARYSRPVVRGLVAAAAVSVLLVPLVVKALGAFGLGDGVHELLIVSLLWWVGAGGSAWLVWTRGRGLGLDRLARAGPALEALVVVLLVGVLLTLTRLRSIDLAAFAISVALSAAVLWISGRWTPPRLGRRAGGVVEIVGAMVLILCVTNVVVFQSAGIPNSLSAPGIYQFHQDFLLAPANQLLGGGALLVNVPVSQYGVGFIDFLYGWFHIAPIGYGTYGLLDGIITALFYIAGYAIVRVAGVGRPLAAAVITLAVIAFILHLQYPIGALPQQGPLRFGLPIVVVLAAVIGRRWPHRVRFAQALSLATLAVAAVWSAEMLVYTVFVLAAVTACEAWLEPSDRRRFVVRRLGSAVIAVVIGHVFLATWTLVATGSLPDWGGYLAYVNAYVLGHSDLGQASYGFQSWSPAFAAGFGCLASVAGLVLLLLRAPGPARAQPVLLTALAGTTAYAVALYSYTDNRSSTYYLPYVALPVLLAGALWLSFGIERSRTMAIRRRGWLLAPVLAVASLMVAAAWPTVSERFSESAMAHVLPGHGLRRALHRLWHSPPIDPRSPTGVALLSRYEPGHGALVVLPDAEDLETEILLRAHRPNLLYIADPKSDAVLHPSQWTGRIGRQLARLRPGAHLLTDDEGVKLAALLRDHPESLPLQNPLDFKNPELEWVLQRLSDRFDLVPVYRAPSGLIVVRLQSRR